VTQNNPTFLACLCPRYPLHGPRGVGYVAKTAVTNFSIFQNRKKDILKGN